MRDLDPNDTTPTYLQLAAVIREAIVSGEFEPGDQLPSRAELQERYDISHMTIGRAIETLQRERLVYSRVGRGSYVSDPPAVTTESDPHTRNKRQLEIRERIQVLRTRQDVFKQALLDVTHEQGEQGQRTLFRLAINAGEEERELLAELVTILAPSDLNF